MSTYKVQIINPEEKEKFFQTLTKMVKFERKANIHGACVKLLTDNDDFKETWEENFKFMNEDIRPHAKIFAVENGGPLQVLYEPVSKTSIILNCDYYGWIKSIALATISDFFEDYHSIHRRYSVHGSVVDYMGHSIAIIGPSGTGKTTLTYGLLLDNDFNYVSDDWFFTRLFDNGTVVYSSEKNSYIRDDLADVWTEFAPVVRSVRLDQKGRGIADVNNLFKGRIRDTSTLRTVVLLKRDKEDAPFRKLDDEQALEYMVYENFCNPHQLVTNQHKINLRRKFFGELFSKIDVYMLNTIESPGKSLSRIKNLAKR